MGDRKNPKIKIYVKFVGNAVCALSILFVLSALRRIAFDFGQVKDWRVFLAVCAAGIVLKTVTVFLSGSAWCLWLEFFSGRRCNRRETLRVYAKANIGKYLPGNVMHYVERNLFAEKLELSQKQIAAATAIEIASLVLAAFFTGMLTVSSQMQEVLRALMPEDGRFQAAWKQMHLKWGQMFGKQVHLKGDSVYSMHWIMAAVLAVFGLAVIAVLAARHRKRETVSGGIAGREQNGQRNVRKFFKTFLASFVLYTAVLAVLGMILVFLCWYWTGKMAAGEALVIAAGYIAAWVLGFVIPGAPGGIGVREMALTLLLSPVMGREVTAVLSVLHRMITIAGDFAAYLLRGHSG